MLGHASRARSSRWRQLHDLRLRDPVLKLKHTYPVTAVSMSTSGNEVYAGGIDNEIQVGAPCPVGAYSVGIPFARR